jgi:hypothetical protein
LQYTEDNLNDEGEIKIGNNNEGWSPLVGTVA